MCTLVINDICRYNSSKHIDISDNDICSYNSSKHIDISDNDINNEIIALTLRELVHARRPRLQMTQQSPRMLRNFPPGCPPYQKKLCTALLHE